jgi:hypothetical protein
MPPYFFLKYLINFQIYIIYIHETIINIGGLYLGEGNTNSTIDGMLLRENDVYLVISGKILNKRYNKEMKAFLFDIETPKIFVDKPVLSTQQIIFKFAIEKKFHRKLRKVIYDGNNVSVMGHLRNILIRDEDGVNIDRLFLVVVGARQCNAGDNIAKEMIGGLLKIENTKA